MQPDRHDTGSVSVLKLANNTCSTESSCNRGNSNL